MTPEERKQFEEMKREIAELKSQKTEKSFQQITFPLDPASVEVIARALQDASYIIT